MMVDVDGSGCEGLKCSELRERRVERDVENDGSRLLMTTIAGVYISGQLDCTIAVEEEGAGKGNYSAKLTNNR